MTTTVVNVRAGLAAFDVYVEKNGQTVPLKKCTACGEEKRVSEFHKQPMGRFGVEGKCKVCRYQQQKAWDKSANGRIRRAVIQKKYAATENGHEKRAKATRAYQHTAKGRAASRASKERYPEKVAARDAVKRALKTGRLVRPSKCESCGDDPVFTHGHHHDYSKALDVVWLCRNCHDRVHR